MSEYTIVYKDIDDNKIRFIDNLDTYQLLFKLNKIQDFLMTLIQLEKIFSL